MWRNNSDDDMGLESLSEPDADTDHHSAAGDETSDDDSDPRASPTGAQVTGLEEGSDEAGRDEEDNAITPGPTHHPMFPSVGSRQLSPEVEEDDDDDWEDPVQDTPINGTGAASGTRSSRSPSVPVFLAPALQPAPLPPKRASSQMHALTPPPKQHFPFPRTETENTAPSPLPLQQQRSLRGRLGGRTSSGGVKAVT
jgi:cysteine protease ATG4